MTKINRFLTSLRCCRKKSIFLNWKNSNPTLKIGVFAQGATHPYKHLDQSFEVTLGMKTVSNMLWGVIPIWMGDQRFMSKFGPPRLLLLVQMPFPMFSLLLVNCRIPALSRIVLQQLLQTQGPVQTIKAANLVFQNLAGALTKSRFVILNFLIARTEICYSVGRLLLLRYTCLTFFSLNHNYINFGCVDYYET